MENWLKEKLENHSLDSQKLFEESLICYRVKANRAALLFSYLGFFTIIKERIIRYNGDKIEKKRLNHLIQKLNDDGKWEEAIYNELNNSRSSIFNFSESIRTQIQYWKDRRNDCAHFRENEINHTHVEMFWTFLKSNLNKITIEGGMENLLQKFKTHFDDTRTAPNSDYTHLLNEIDSSIEKNDFQFFMDNLDDFFDEYNPERFLLFYNIVVTLKNTSLEKEPLKWLENKNKFTLYLIYYQPQIANIISFDPKLIRKIWKDKIPERNSEVDSLYSNLLRNSLIPKKEIFESLDYYFQYFDQSKYNRLSNIESVREQLYLNGIGKLVYDYFFLDYKITNIQKSEIDIKADLIVLLLEFENNYDKYILISLQEIFNRGNPWIEPNWLKISIEELLYRKPEIRYIFIDKAKEYEIKLPNFILHEEKAM
ncbi:hypothetical protein [Aureivirga sp. CE67]|uniref:hypothetical protein n=1 Tax=Aureivirga sp. CE67 TaxID=1788983 RepID=UPI0018CB000A|nr:hypothetical protein [Aureivirga sp. CE67]